MKELIFDSQADLYKNLCLELAGKIKNTVEGYGDCRLLLSGGSSPVQLYKAMSNLNLPWHNLIVGLCDERFVPVSSSASNEKLIKETLMTKGGRAAQFYGMVHDLNSIESNLILASKDYEIFADRIDVCVLGMGLDGHTASLFPNDPNSQFGLSDECEKTLVNTSAPSAPQKRISCTKTMLAKSRNSYLILAGEAKVEVFKQSAREKFPIDQFAELKGFDMNVYSTTENE